MSDQIVVEHGRIVRICGRLSTTADGNRRLQATPSCFVDMTFKERLQKAAAHAKVPWGQTAVANSLGLKKQTVDRWFDTGEPKPAQLFQIADRWNVNARWLATGKGEMAAGHPVTSLTPRHELLLHLFGGLTPEQQREWMTELHAAYEANIRVQKFLPKPLRTFSNEEVAAAFGPVPAPRAKATARAKKPRKAFPEEDPE